MHESPAMFVQALLQGPESLPRVATPLTVGSRQLTLRVYLPWKLGGPGRGGGARSALFSLPGSLAPSLPPSSPSSALLRPPGGVCPSVRPRWAGGAGQQQMRIASVVPDLED